MTTVACAALAAAGQAMTFKPTGIFKVWRKVKSRPTRRPFTDYLKQWPENW